MKVLILGASGIVGQHMRLCVPDGVEPVWLRKTADPITEGWDLSDGVPGQLGQVQAVVNLAGESNVDAVEADPGAFYYRNVDVPGSISKMCQLTGKKFIQVSSQAVYQHGSVLSPANEYGHQKRSAECVVLDHGGIVVRLTFILGIRPLPRVGRQNPLEAMLAGQSPQVADRYFSPLFAMDAAELLWDAALNAQPGEVRELGEPVRTTRFDIARLVNPDVTACSHDDFEGLAPRAKDTTYSGSAYVRDLHRINDIVAQYRADDRAIELALFFGMRWDEAKLKLGQGFIPLHHAVTADFNRALPRGDAKLIDWYRTTEAYIWELSAYHEDPGYNYTGMCGGIVTHLQNAGAKRVLCLGDGIGDLTLACHRAGLEPHYHDLGGSRTAAYAAFRFWRQTGGEMQTNQTYSFNLQSDAFGEGEYDAVASLDFLEHVPCVDQWIRAIYTALKPGGLFVAQNAFNCGSGEDGSIPMHLAVNDRWEKDWDPFLLDVGFEQLASNWYRRKE